MASDFLDKIVEHKKSLLKKKKAFLDALKNNVENASLTSYGLFKKSISKPGQVNLIAEIKKASPSKGLICQDFNVTSLARAYEENGAAAISVLTEEQFFCGKPLYVREVSQNYASPVLAKDFFIDEAQIYEAFSFGASAILLIMAILEDKRVVDLMKVASQFDMDCLVEVHNEQELERALKCGADIIGINRDIRNMTIIFFIIVPILMKLN